MIKLDVCEYCHGCLEFEPYVAERPYLFHTLNCDCICGDTIVECENHRKCEVLYNHLKKKNDSDS